MSVPAVLSVHIDGAARGNPGPASYAYVFAGEGMPAIEEHGCLGSTTNNVAEYTALVRALERAAQLGARRLQVHSDSELLVKQMNGEYKVKNPNLLELYEQAKELAKRFDVVSIRHVPRSANRDADRLCNEALDGGAKSAPQPQARHKTETSAAVQPLRGQAREEALVCLRSAAAAWARGNPADPPPEGVWDQLWSVLEENGVLARPSRRRRVH